MTILNSGHSADDLELLAAQQQVKDAFQQAIRGHHNAATAVESHDNRLPVPEHEALARILAPLVEKALTGLPANCPDQSRRRRYRGKAGGSCSAARPLRNRRAPQPGRETGFRHPAQGWAPARGSDDRVPATQASSAPLEQTVKPAEVQQSAVEALEQSATRPVDLYWAEIEVIRDLMRHPKLFVSPWRQRALRELIERFLAPPYPDAQEAKLPYHVRLERRLAAASGVPSLASQQAFDVAFLKAEADLKHWQNGDGQ